MHRKEIEGVRAALEEMAKTKEGNAFGAALKAARENGDKTFTVAGKEYKCEDFKEDDFKPHMMYDPKTGKAYKAEKPEDHERMSKMGYTHEKPDVKEFVTVDGAKRRVKEGDQRLKANKKVEDASNDKSDDGDGLDKVDPKAAKKKFADRKDKDLDNDGDTDSSDEYLHKKRKAIGKAMAKEAKEFDAKKMDAYKKFQRDAMLSHDAVVHSANNPNSPETKKFMKNKKFASAVKMFKAAMKEDTVRERLTSIWEDAAGAKRTMGATDPEPMTRDDDHGTKKMKDAHKIDMDVKDKDDSEKAEKEIKPSPTRNGDKKDGEKAIKPSATPDHPANKSTKEQFDALKDAYAMVESMDKIMTVDIDHTTMKTGSHERKMGIKIKPNNNGQNAVDATGKKGDLQKYLIKHYGGKRDAMELHPEIFKK